jgi:hypothetical protein
MAGLFVFVGACSTTRKAPTPDAPVILRFVADQDLGLIVHPIDWFRSADQDNPGVDCTLKLETQGPPENVYSCVVKDARNVFIVKISESYMTELEERHLSKITIDSKWAATRDLWIEELKKSKFKEGPKNPSGSRGERWEFTSPDGSTLVTIFWNERAGAVSVWVSPLATVPAAPKAE